MPICPFLSTNRYEQCFKECALYADNGQCALKNLGNVKPEKSDEDDDDDLDY